MPLTEMKEKLGHELNKYMQWPAKQCKQFAFKFS